MDSSPPTAPRAQSKEGAAGSQIGRFMVLGPLHTGHTGVVVAAYDPELDRKVAIKLLDSSDLSESEREQFAQEARAMASLSHKNILAVYDVGAIDGGLFMAMEFAGGGNLHDWLHEKKRTTRQVLDQYLLAGEGLAAAHRAGLIHGDFSARNVLLTQEGDIRVARFGVALTTPGAEPASELADQYAFSEAVYRALAGEAPPVSSAGMRSDGFVVGMGSAAPSGFAGSKPGNSVSEM